MLDGFSRCGRYWNGITSGVVAVIAFAVSDAVLGTIKHIKPNDGATLTAL
jgi:hypothetical protein